jgi:hypothetical protein
MRDNILVVHVVALEGGLPAFLAVERVRASER